MESTLTYSETCSAYPGHYVPLCDIEIPGTDQMITAKEPLINMDEFDDHFKIEVAVPGIRKEDILISLHESVLCVTVFHRPAPGAARKTRIHEFDVNYFERHIELPEKADAQLISADYREGILNLFIPKTAEPAKNQPLHIAVY